MAANATMVRKIPPIGMALLPLDWRFDVFLLGTELITPPRGASTGRAVIPCDRSAGERARGVVEQLVDGEAPGDEFLHQRILDRELEGLAYIIDAEAQRIELAVLGRVHGAPARQHRAVHLADDVGARFYDR